jgi:hypothetical protein
VFLLRRSGRAWADPEHGRKPGRTVDATFFAASAPRRFTLPNDACFPL